MGIPHKRNDLSHVSRLNAIDENQSNYETVHTSLDTDRLKVIDFLYPMIDVTPLPSLHQDVPATDQLVLREASNLAKVVEELLERADLSQTAASKQLGITRQSLHQYVVSRRTSPSVQWLARLCNLCGAKLIVEWPQSPEGR